MRRAALIALASCTAAPVVAQDSIATRLDKAVSR